jgi:hypothetical protein
VLRIGHSHQRIRLGLLIAKSKTLEGEAGIIDENEMVSAREPLGFFLRCAVNVP